MLVGEIVVAINALMDTDAVFMTVDEVDTLINEVLAYSDEEVEFNNELIKAYMDDELEAYLDELRGER
jgi:ABC-type maltose transport system permease subunit